MPTPEQKKHWQAEKAQLLRDKQNQPREIRRQAKTLSFGGTKPTQPTRNTSAELPSDEFLRQRLGI